MTSPSRKQANARAAMPLSGTRLPITHHSSIGKGIDLHVWPIRQSRAHLHIGWLWLRGRLAVKPAARQWLPISGACETASCPAVRVYYCTTARSSRLLSS